MREASHRKIRSANALLLASVAGVAVLAGCQPERLQTAAPKAVSDDMRPLPMPELPQSVVDAPITYALDPALSALERAVPLRFGDLEKRIQIPSNKRQQIAFVAERTPFDISFRNMQLAIGTTVSYQGRGWYDPPLSPTISAGCGSDSLPPRLRVVLTTDLSLTSDWGLRTKTRLVSVAPVSNQPRDICRVSAFQIDVTDRVIKSLIPFLETRLRAVDQRIGGLDVRSRIEGWYNLLNRNIRVTDSLWLQLAPREVRLGDLSLEDSALVANVRLFARPRLVSGPRPAEVSTSLPPFTRARSEVGDSAHLLLEGLMTYPDANAVLAKALVGRSFRRFNNVVHIDSAAIFPLGGGRVALAIGLGGAVSGVAYLTGTPQLDSATRTLSVPDLDFDVSTAGALVRSLAWLKRDDIVAELRKRARVPLDPILEDTRDKVDRAINRQLAKGVALTGSVRTGRILDVAAQPRWIVVRAAATGSLGLHVDRDIPTPRRARTR